MDKVPKTFNARFSKEVFWAIADLVGAKYGRDKTEAVERAVLEARDRVMGVSSNFAYPAPALAQPQAAQPVPQDVGFTIQCRHCGERALGATKFATICFGCKSDGHSNEPRECPVCTSQGTGAL